MATTVIANTTVVSGNSERSVYYDSNIVVEDGLISEISQDGDLSTIYRGAEVIDGRDKAVFPGFINCHAHITATIDRGITDDFGFPFPFRFPENVRNLISQEELSVFAMLGAIECIRTGSTGVVEVASGIERYAEEIVSTGLRWFLAECGGDAVVGPEYKPGEPVTEFSDAQREKVIENSLELFKKWDGYDNGRITFMTGTTLVETSSPRLLSEIRQLSERVGCAYTIHLNQSRLEVNTALEMHGKRPAQYLVDSDFLSPRLLAAHVRYPNDDEIRLLGENKVAISHQPAMAARRGVIPPIPSLRDAGCTIAMGTDNNTQDMVQAMKPGRDVLVATPGRLLDLMGQGHIFLDEVGIFVLDEADRMLDMGFIHDVRRVLKELPEKRQTLLFSATMPNAITQLSKRILRDPVRVEVTPEVVTVEKINQVCLEKRQHNLCLRITKPCVAFHIEMLLFDQTERCGFSYIFREI